MTPHDYEDLLLGALGGVRAAEQTVHLNPDEGEHYRRAVAAGWEETLTSAGPGKVQRVAACRLGKLDRRLVLVQPLEVALQEPPAASKALVDAALSLRAEIGDWAARWPQEALLDPMDFASSLATDWPNRPSLKEARKTARSLLPPKAQAWYEALRRLVSVSVSEVPYSIHEAAGRGPRDLLEEIEDRMRGWTVPGLTEVATLLRGAL